MLSHRALFDGNLGGPYVVVMAEITEEELIATWNEGYIWVRAASLAPAAPDGAWVGIHVRQGELRFATEPVIDGDGNWSGVDRVDLDISPFEPAAPADIEGPGADAAASSYIPPQLIRMTFQNAAADSFDLGASSVTLFENTIELPAANVISFDVKTFALVAPLAISSQILEPVTRSKNYRLSGKANLQAAMWSLPMTLGAIAGLGETQEIGATVLTVGPGLQARLPDQELPIPLRACQWIRSLRELQVVEQGPAAADPAIRVRLSHELWLKSDGESQSRMETEVTGNSVCAFASVAGIQETVNVRNSSVTSQLDRPLGADGKAIPLDGIGGSLTVIDNGGEKRFSILTGEKSGGEAIFALQNALLCMRGPMEVLVAGKLGEGRVVTEGEVRMRYALVSALPYMPDPYVCNFEPAPKNGGEMELVVQVIWSPDQAPRIELQYANTGEELAIFLRHSFPEELVEVSAFPEKFGRLRSNVAHELHRTRLEYWLLDVSGNSGQWGVAFVSNFGVVPQEAAFRDLLLHWSPVGLAAFTLPAIQWEPVFDVASGTTLRSVDDGGPSGLAASSNSVRLVPVAPQAATAEIVGFMQGGNRGDLVFTLPCGIDGHIAMNSVPGVGLAPHHSLTLAEEEYGNYRGTRQVRFVAATGEKVPGWVQQRLNLFPAAPLDSVLAPMGGKFNLKFDTEAPISQYDLSGYGASCFSRWNNPTPNKVDVVHARFDVLVGRTSHEVVRFINMLWPPQAIAVREITMERTGSGAVARHDSGWVPTTPGEFWRGEMSFHPGLVQGYYNIRNIREHLPSVQVGSFEVVPVTFDADVAIEGVVRGHFGPAPQFGNRPPAGLVPVQNHSGFVQLKPVGGDLDAEHLEDILRRLGPFGGPIDCEIRLPSTNATMRLISMDTGTARLDFIVGLFLQFLVAVRGTPTFPRSGEWNAVRRRPASGGRIQTMPVDARRGVPLIRIGQVTSNGVDTSQPCRFAEPSERFQTTSEYAFLFSNGSSRSLFPSPEVRAGRIQGTEKAQIADPLALALSADLFPSSQLAGSAGADYALDLAGATVLPTLNAPRPGPVELAKGPGYRAYIEGGAPLGLTIGDRKWEFDSAPQTLVVELFDKIKWTIQGRWRANADGTREFIESKVGFPTGLEEVISVIGFLNQLQGDGNPPMQFHLHREGNTGVVLEVSLAVGLGGPLGERVDIGMGKLGGSLRVGLQVRASLTTEASGTVFLEITGDFQQAIIPKLLYAGGHLRFFIGVQDNGEPVLDLTAGTIGSIGGDLIPLLVSLEGTVKYGYSVIRPPSGSLDKIRPGLEMGMEVRAEVASGLIGIRFSWDGRAVIGIAGSDMTIQADIHVSAGITTAWIFKSDYDLHARYEAEVPLRVVALAAAVATVGVGPAAIGAAATE